MRRFYGFIIMIVSMLAVVLFNVQGQYYRFNTGLEYSRGTQITYAITPNTDDDDFDIQQVADLFIDRLEDANAEDYYVDTLVDNVLDSDTANNQYQIQVSLPGVEDNQANILRSLEAYGNIRITTTHDEVVEGDFEMIEKSARLDYNGSSAYVDIDITDEFADLCEKLEASSSDGETANVGDLIIIWKDYDETVDSYEEACKSETLEQLDMRDRILAVLDSSAYHKAEEGGNAFLRITAIGFSNNSVSTNNLYADSAHSVVRLLNSDPLDYEITRLYTISLDAQYGNNALLFSGIAILAILVAVAVILIIKYGINGLIGITTLLFALFISIVVYNFFNITVSPVFLLAILVSIGMGLTILVSYFERFKNEIYKGRTLQKASKDAYRSTISTAIDSTIFTLVTSAVIAFIARNSMQSFFIFLIISSVVNFLVCLFLTRLLMYWIVNSKKGEDKKLYRIKEDKIPNVNNEESQTYFGEHENFSTEKHNKKAFIGLLVGAIVSVGALTTFSLASSTFNYTNEFNSYTMIQIIDTNGKDNFPNKENVEDFFDSVNLEAYEINIEVEDDPKDEDGEKQIYYIEAKFHQIIGDEDQVRDDLITKLEDLGFSFITSEDESSDAIYFLHVAPQVMTPNFNNAIFLILLTSLFAIAYSIIRYRYTFTLATITTVAADVLLTTGVISLLRVPVSSNMGVALVASVFVVALFEFIILIKYAQLVKENKTKVALYEERKEIIETALRRSITPIMVIYVAAIAALGLFAAITPKELLTVYIVMALAISIGLLLLLFIFVPVYLYAERHLRIKRKVKAKKDKKISKRRQEKIRQQNIRNKRLASEPEEVIIPGIND